MKKILLISASAIVASAAFTTNARTIDDNSRFLELGIGVGASEHNGTSGMFTQRIASEWIVKDNVFRLFEKDFALGLGFQLDNSVGGRYSTFLSGEYDYSYNITITKHKKDNGHGRPITTTETQRGHRKGVGVATADVTRDNLCFMPTVSLHAKIIDNFDFFVTYGMGLGIMTNSLGNYEPTDYVPGIGHIKNGMEKIDYYNKTTMPNGDVKETRYSYNDAEHAEYNKKGYETKATFACAFYVGARYFINDSWGINAQFGLVSANVKKSYGNSYNILSVGATYSF